MGGYLDKIQAFVKLSDYRRSVEVVKDQFDQISLYVNTGEASDLLLEIIDSLPMPNQLTRLQITHSQLGSELDLSKFEKLEYLDLERFDTDRRIILPESLNHLHLKNCDFRKLYIPENVVNWQNFSTKVSELEMSNPENLIDLRDVWSELPSFDLPASLEFYVKSLGPTGEYSLFHDTLKNLFLIGHSKNGHMSRIDSMILDIPNVTYLTLRDFIIEKLEITIPLDAVIEKISAEIVGFERYES